MRSVGMTETDLKRQIKDYLAIKGIYSFPLIQGLGSAKGLPDRVMHFKGSVVYLEIKKPKGQLSIHQAAFGITCVTVVITYLEIRSLDDIMNYVEGT